MNIAANVFKDALEKKDIKYIEEREDLIRVSFTGENATSIRTTFKFGDDNKDVSVHVFSICKVPDAKYEKACVLCSTLNAKWRWVKFYIDNDKEVTAEIDAVIDAYTAGDECSELLFRIVDIVDKSYPEIMQMLWN